jgi:hypothetical protein
MELMSVKGKEMGKRMVSRKKEERKAEKGRKMGG